MFFQLWLAIANLFSLRLSAPQANVMLEYKFFGHQSTREIQAQKT